MRRDRAKEAEEAESNKVSRKTKRPLQRRRPRRRRSRSSPPDGDERSSPCRSSLADKASDYEDIWGTSPTEENPPAMLAAGEDMVLHDQPDEDSSSNSTLEKMTSVSSGYKDTPPDSPSGTLDLVRVDTLETLAHLKRNG